MKRLFKNMVSGLAPFISDNKYLMKYYPYDKNYLIDISRSINKEEIKVIFDVGANVGQSSKKFRKFFPAAFIYAFEPVSKTFEDLKANLSFIKSISLNRLAFSDYHGESLMNVLDSKSETNSLIDEVNIDVNAGIIEKVELQTVDFFAEQNNIRQIDLLKIDTEGSDFLVLQGARQMLRSRSIDLIYTEVGFRHEKDKGDFFHITEFLRDNGYLFCGLYDTYRWGSNNLNVKFSNALYKRYKS